MPRGIPCVLNWSRESLVPVRLFCTVFGTVTNRLVQPGQCCHSRTRIALYSRVQRRIATRLRPIHGRITAGTVIYEQLHKTHRLEERGVGQHGHATVIPRCGCRPCLHQGLDERVRRSGTLAARLRVRMEEVDTHDVRKHGDQVPVEREPRVGVDHLRILDENLQCQSWVAHRLLLGGHKRTDELVRMLSVEGGLCAEASGLG
jgi:hypothetical protein